jgi:rSAM/selenodomain-associated transferase 1
MNEGREKRLLVVVAKAPLPGNVKTRLFPRLSPVEAAELYRCFVEDTAVEMSGLKGECDIAIAYTPENAYNTFASLSPDGFGLFAQMGNDLGERLCNIFKEKLSEGYDTVSIIDSDSPDLPMSLVQESFRLLSSGNSDVVFGPCDDGGYYLVAMKKAYPDLFVGIPWSTSSVLSMSLEKSKKLGIKASLLPRWNDIDTFEDLIEFFDKYRDRFLRGRCIGVKTLSYLLGLKQLRCRGENPGESDTSSCYKTFPRYLGRLE